MVQKLSFTLLSVALATSLSAQTPWIHVEVDEVGEGDTHVKVNLPLSVIEIAAEAAPENILSHGRLDLDHLDKDIEVEDVRRMWAELRDAGDGELVSVESADETVEIRRDGDQVVVEVDDAEGGDKVRIHIAITVVDALLSGDGDELDVRAAIEELRKSTRGEVVMVDDGETKVRIWIDETD